MKKIIIILSVALGIVLWLYFAKEGVETIKTVTTYDTITKVIDNTKPTKIEKVYIKVVDTIYKTKTVNLVVTDTVYKDKEVKKYTYKDSLPNGELTSIIYADNIYKRDIKLKTFNKNEKTTIKLYKSVFYVGGGIMSDFDKRLDNVYISGYYTHKNKFLLGLGYGYSATLEKPTLNFQLAFKF